LKHFVPRKENYSVTTCNNGRDAIDIFENENFDIVFLDENMPGMSGLETSLK
jgi:CheY-like chemotaxis protein